MPAKKPHALNTRKETKAERNARIAAEAATAPKSFLPKQPPAALRDHAMASRIWAELIQLYAETEGTLATAFDANIIAKYCLLEEECLWLEEKRRQNDELSTILAKRLQKKNLGELTPKEEFLLWQQYNALVARTQGLDARLDGKRKLLVTISQSLYLTPRSRAGVAPQPKAPEKPTSDLSKAMDAI